MSKTDKVLRWAEVAATVIFALAAVGGFFVYLGGQQEQVVARATVPCYSPPGGASFVAGSGCTVNVQSGGTLQIDSGATETHANALSISGATTLGAATATTVTASGGLGLGAETFTGTVHFGSATAVTSGTTVLHGFTTTPTSFIVQENGLQSATVFSQTLYAFNCNTTTCAIGVSEGTISSFTINWMAGK